MSKTFAIKLRPDQRYFEPVIADLLKNSADEASVAEILADLLTISVTALLLNAPEGSLEDVKEHLVLYIEGWRENTDADH